MNDRKQQSEKYPGMGRDSLSRFPSSDSEIRRSPHIPPILHLHRTIGNRAVQKALTSAVLQRHHQPAQDTAIDGPYRLYRHSSDATSYVQGTQNYYLSGWDIARLRRQRGFYFIQDSLVAPPEVRAAAGGRGVLLDLSLAEKVQFAAAPDASAFVIALAQSRLGVSVTSVTTASGPDRDFSRPDLPDPMRRGLENPPAHIAGVQDVRDRAGQTPQEPTLGTAGSGHLDLPRRDLAVMDVATLDRMSDVEQAAWFVEKLGAFQAQLYESAGRSNIPTQLLAAVILNELGDINFIDIVQSGPWPTRGSLGISQIQIDTALRDRLVDVSDAEALRTYAEYIRAAGHAHTADMVLEYVPRSMQIEQGRRVAIGRKLQVPQFAIEAAAREIALLLTRMGQNQDKPWQTRHHFTASGPSGLSIYQQVGTGSQIGREGALATMVTAAYNSPDIIITSDPSEERYPNARAHGDNGGAVARSLYVYGLFRTS